MVRFLSAWLMIALVSLTASERSAGAQSVASHKRDVAFVKRNIASSLKTIRNQLRQGKHALAAANIRGVTRSLERIARATRAIRGKEPGYTPNPPVDFDATPAKARRGEYLAAKKLAIDAARQLNAKAQQASATLQSAKRRQLKTIAITMLKFTVENAPGRQGGKVLDFAVEGVKKLNGYLLDRYIKTPIARISAPQLLRNNFIAIRDGARLVSELFRAQKRALAFARKMDAQARQLDGAAGAERAWQKFRWLQQRGARSVTVRLTDVRIKDLELTLGGRKLSNKSRGVQLQLPIDATVSARVRAKMATFIKQKRQLANRSRTITLERGPGGGPLDSLVYSSTRIPARSSWLITSETFTWRPSGPLRITPAPRAVRGAYWPQKRARVRLSLPQKAGQSFSFFVRGDCTWQQKRMIRGRIRGKKVEKEQGSATVVFRVVR